MKTTVSITTIVESLSESVCIHGMTQKWCAFCRHQAGDKNAGRVIKAFTPKKIKRAVITSH